MTLTITWSSGSTEDSKALSKLLLKTNYHYRSLVLHSTADLLQEGDSLLGWQGGELVSATMAGGDNFPVVDLLLAAASDSVVLDQLICDGLPLLEARITAKRGRWLRVLGGPTWLTLLLSPRYELVDTVVFYQRSRSPDVPQPEPIEGLQVKCIATTDLRHVKRVDEASFTPFWQANAPSLERWLQNDNRAFALVARSQVVAYIITGLQNQSGHIWRLAVLPEWQGRGLGRWMMTSAMAGLLADGAMTISLNTQANNQRARSLYEGLGFAPTGQEVFVWARDLSLL